MKSNWLTYKNVTPSESTQVDERWSLLNTYVIQKKEARRLKNLLSGNLLSLWRFIAELLSALNDVHVSFRRSDKGATEKSILKPKKDSSSVFVPQTSVGITNSKNPIFKIQHLTFIILLTLSPVEGFSQAVSINPTGASPDPSAMLDVSSTDKGFLPPRLTTSQMNAISSPTAGLLIFNSDENRHYYYSGTSWLELKSTQADSAAVPIGTIMPFGGDSSKVPNGFLLCDGASLSTTTYSDLFGVIGYSWGGSGGSFNLPDLRGRFLRGTDYGAGNDPDAASRTAINTGGNTGDEVGSLQEDEFESHVHTQTRHDDNPPSGQAYAGGGLLGNNLETINTGSAGGNETRPKNANVNYIICFSSTIAASSGSGAFQGSVDASQISGFIPQSALPGNVTDTTRISDSDQGTSVSVADESNIIFTSGAAESARINATGYLGINNNNPSTWLDMNVASSNTGLQLRGDFEPGIKLDAYGTKGEAWEIFSASGATAEGQGNLVFYNRTDAQTRMAIDSTGNVILGSAPPSSYHKLSVSSPNIGGIMRLNQENTTLASEFGLFVNDNFKWSIGGTDDANTSGESFFVYNNDRGATDFFIDGDNGRTAFGTTNPFGKIHVDNSGGDVAIMTSSSDAEIGYVTGTDFEIVGVNDSTGAIEERPFIITGGSVGIGTSSPTASLDIRSPGTDDAALFSIGNSDKSHHITLFPGRQNDPNPFLQWKQGDPLRFATDSGGYFEAMRITSNGNVGIGTISPNFDLHIKGRFEAEIEDTTTQKTAFSLNNGLTNSQGLLFKYAYDAIGDVPAQTWQIRSTGSGARDIAFTRFDSKTLLYLEMTNDRVGIGTTTPVVDLDVNGNGRYTSNLDVENEFGVRTPSGGNYLIFKGTNNTAWQVTTAGTSSPVTLTFDAIGTFTTYFDGSVFINGATPVTSDSSFKTEVTPLTNVLSKLELIEGVSYFWDTLNFADRNFSQTQDIGLIAQKLQRIYPQLVLQREDGYLAVDYSKFTAVLLQATKEQQAIIDSLKTSIQQQSKEIKTLKAQNESNLNEKEIFEARLREIENQLGIGKSQLKNYKHE